MDCLYFEKLSFNSDFYITVESHATSHSRGTKIKYLASSRSSYFTQENFSQENHETTSLLTAVQMPGGMYRKTQLQHFCWFAMWLRSKWDEIGVSDNDELVWEEGRMTAGGARSNLNPKMISWCSKSPNYRKCTNLNLNQPRHSLWEHHYSQESASMFAEC